MICPHALGRWNEEHEHAKSRYASLCEDSSHPWIRCNPAVGFGTLIPDPLATKQAAKTAFEVGFRHLDCAERYRIEEAVGNAMQAVFRAGTIRREDVFVTTKLWNTNHRPERVKPAFDASLRRLQIDYADCYLIHTPFAF